MTPPSVANTPPIAGLGPSSQSNPSNPGPQVLNNTRICKCKCDPDCNCSCPCIDHCTCRQKHNQDCEDKCTKDCGSRKPFRNLIVCIDGTSNQFGHRNTNVVELCNRILKDGGDVQQLTFYSSGIGTYVPGERRSLAYWLKRFDNMIDLAFAWNFKRIVGDAYRWLVDQYRPGDRIYLFGFSRGAYQVRVLAGMIEKLGLGFSGNKHSFFLAYELYANKHKGREIKDEAEAEALAANFKSTFSRNVKVHFVGVWDTVSSVGFVRQRPLPLTTYAFHICYFRHGLALDERRVKFLPEFLAGGRTPQFDNEYYDSHQNTNVEEVWFMGTHADIGGSTKRHNTFDLSRIPLLWMENEASETGLCFSAREAIREWKWDHLKEDKPTQSLAICSLWWPLEILCIKRFLYTEVEITTRWPHWGRGRSIVPRQHIHASVVFKNSETYTPAARFVGDEATNWAALIGIGGEDNLEDLSWADEWEHLLEMDLFDDDIAQDIIRKLFGTTKVDIRNQLDERLLLLRRLSLMALSKRCAKQISGVIGDLVAMLSAKEDWRIRAASASCLFQLAKHWYDQQILDNGAGLPLQTMLHDKVPEVQVASLQCLSHLILNPNEDKAWFQMSVESTVTYYEEARPIMTEPGMDWPNVLLRLITSRTDTSESKTKSNHVLGVSCLARLAKIKEIREAFIQTLKSTESKESNGAQAVDQVQSLAATLVDFLGDIRTRYHTSIVLQRMSKELHNEITSDKKTKLRDGLLLMIQNGHAKAKGGSVLCLSSYFDIDSRFREISISYPAFIVVLVTKLFGINHHCFPAQKKAVMAAFLKIVNHSDSANILAEPKVVKAIIKALSVDRWLEVDEASDLLSGILSRDPGLNKCSDKVKKAFIEELVTIGVDDDALYRTQAYFRALYNSKDDELRELLRTRQVISTVVDALLHEHSRENAVRFLKCIIQDDKARRTMVNISFPYTVVALGQNAVNRRRSAAFCNTLKVFAALRQNAKKGNRSICPVIRNTLKVFIGNTVTRDSGALSAVRNVLEVLSQHVADGDIEKFFLQPDVFEIVVKDMTTDNLEIHEGHRVNAQIAGFKCLQNLVKNTKVLPMVLEGLQNEKIQLFDLLQAFDDEPESSKWLRRWSDYGKVLEDTLKQLSENEATQKFAKDLDRRSSLRKKFAAVASRGRSNGNVMAGSTTAT